MARTLNRAGIEERLDTLIRRSGEQAANRLRDEIRSLAPALDLEDEASVLDAMIGALLGTREVELAAPPAVARLLGRALEIQHKGVFGKRRDGSRVWLAQGKRMAMVGILKGSSGWHDPMSPEPS